MSSPVASYFALSAQAPAALKSLRQSVPSKVSPLQSLFAVPTATELQAWWELCRLQNGMGCATVFLPLGKSFSRSPSVTKLMLLLVAWSIAMVYHAQTNLTGLEALTRAFIYFFLCIGIKCLVRDRVVTQLVKD